MFEFNLMLGDEVEQTLAGLGVWASQTLTTVRDVLQDAPLGREEGDPQPWLTRLPDEWLQYHWQGAEHVEPVALSSGAEQVVFDRAIRRRYLAWEREVLHSVGFRPGWADRMVNRQERYLAGAATLFDPESLGTWIGSVVPAAHGSPQELVLDLRLELAPNYDDAGGMQVGDGFDALPVDVSGGLICTANLIAMVMPGTFPNEGLVSWGMGALLAARGCIDPLCRRRWRDPEMMADCVSGVVDSLLGLVSDV